MKKQWVGAGLFLLLLFLASFLIPPFALDPWGLFRPQKIVLIFFALSAVQFFGAGLTKVLGHRVGALMSGFIGGLLSSTATTVSIAKDSHEVERSQTLRIAALQSSILAMLLETVAFLAAAGGVIALEVVHIHLVILISMTVGLLVMLWRRKPQRPYAVPPEGNILDVASTLKLTGFIVLIMAASKAVQIWAGSQGLMLLTFVVSLFEVHGSLISSAQLYASSGIDSAQYEKLVEISLLASYCAKGVLIAAISNSAFRTRALLSLLPAFLFLVFHSFGFIEL